MAQFEKKTMSRVDEFYSILGPNPASFCFSSSFFNAITNILQLTLNGKSVDGVLGIRTWDCRREDIDESTELFDFFISL